MKCYEVVLLKIPNLFKKMTTKQKAKISEFVDQISNSILSDQAGVRSASLTLHEVPLGSVPDDFVFGFLFSDFVSFERRQQNELCDVDDYLSFNVYMFVDIPPVDFFGEKMGFGDFIEIAQSVASEMGVEAGNEFCEEYGVNPEWIHFNDNIRDIPKFFI